MKFATQISPLLNSIALLKNMLMHIFAILERACLVLKEQDGEYLIETGRDKRTRIAALRQAKSYPPRQAAAAVIHDLLVDCGCRNP